MIEYKEQVIPKFQTYNLNMKKLLLIIYIVAVYTSCKKTDDVTPSTPTNIKNVRVEVNFIGDYKDYELLFTNTSMRKKSGESVQPKITQPSNEVFILENSTYYYVNHILENQFVIESVSGDINHIGFDLTLRNRDTDKVVANPATANVRIIYNNNVVSSYTVIGNKRGQDTVKPLVVRMGIN